MPRGRPRKYPIVEEKIPTAPVEIIATVIAQHCGIPGCVPKFHLEEAQAIISFMKKAGYEVVNANRKTTAT